jgi:P27 family predicted phage terminase small subunit
MDHRGGFMPGVKGQRSGGHNAKTQREHRLAGTFNTTKHSGYRNPDPVSGIPVSPKKLTGDAAAEWDRMLQRLTESKILSGVDAGALYQYCRLFAETEACADRLDEASASINLLEESLGDFKGAELIAAFQEMTKMRQLEAGYINKIRQGRMGQRVWLVEFGLTPASRGRVKLPETPEDDPFDEFDDAGGSH